MKTEEYFYSFESEFHNVPLGLKRAGVMLYWDFERKEYTASSRFIERFSFCGESEEQALQAFGLGTQEADNWRQVADEFFSHIPDYLLLQMRLASHSDMNVPMVFWLEVVWRLFENAYLHPANEDTISRVYAYAEWTVWQRQDNEDPSMDLFTVVMLCFFESLADRQVILQDAPRWINLEHLIDVTCPAFRNDVIKAFERFSMI